MSFDFLKLRVFGFVKETKWKKKVVNFISSELSTWKFPKKVCFLLASCFWQKKVNWNVLFHRKIIFQHFTIWYGNFTGSSKTTKLFSLKIWCRKYFKHSIQENSTWKMFVLVNCFWRKLLAINYDRFLVILSVISKLVNSTSTQFLMKTFRKTVWKTNWKVVKKKKKLKI